MLTDVTEVVSSRSVTPKPKGTQLLPIKSAADEFKVYVTTHSFPMAAHKEIGAVYITEP